MTIDQKDIIETIDRLYVKAEKANAGGPPAAYEAAMLELHSALVGNWPALRDRLREAERRAKAFDLIAGRKVGIVSEPSRRGGGDVWLASLRRQYEWHKDKDLLKAIEAALSKETTT